MNIAKGLIMIFGVKCKHCNQILKLSEATGKMDYCSCGKLWVDKCLQSELFRYNGYLCGDIVDENLNIVVDEYIMSKRAVTNEQKREIVEQLYTIWCRVPELRLGQMIYNYFEEPELHYIEDKDFIAVLDHKTNE